jgi:ribose-phosphate pyrophosphokinase
MLGAAARRASVARITACFPYMAYSRQERKSKSGEPIAAADLVHDFDASGYERLIAVDLHAAATQGFTGRPFEHLTAAPVLRDRLREWVDEHGRKHVVLVAPDAGRAKAVAIMAEQLDIKYAIVDKRRDKKTGKSAAKKIIGKVKGKHAMLYDDMIDGGGTLKTAAERLAEKRALSVGAIATHGILSENAPENIASSPLDIVIVTNTLPQAEKQVQIPKLEVVSMVPMMAKAVSRVHRKKSLSRLFDGLNQS